ncbi:MAG: hypothetical protein KAX84_13535 [Burkholderiales bacterium]|nr:hypothetical protein [Burkholderiales bacterium]
MNVRGFALVRRFAVTAIVAAAATCSVAAPVARDSLPAEAVTLATARQQLAKASVPFVPNAGQWDARAAYAARTLAGTLFVTTEGKLVYRLPGGPGSDTPAAGKRPGARPGGPPAQLASGWTLIESFVDAQGGPLAAKPQGKVPGTAKVSYFAGDARRHQSGIGTYERIDLGDVFAGVNVQLRATGGNVEKIFTVAPQQDPQRVQVRLDGATRLEIGGHGELLAHTDLGPVTYTAPVAYQEDAAGARTLVDVHYALARDSARDANETPGVHDTNGAAPLRYGFAVGAYDRARPLIIDPLLQSTYLGGGGYDNPYSNTLAIHPHTGEIYIAGFTESSPFPGLTGGPDTTSASSEAFVSRFSSDLTRLLQSTYLGAGNGDRASALAVHPVTGDVYVAGETNSGGGAFPGAAGGAQPDLAGDFDGFVSRLSSDLQTLHGSTYLGGSGFDTISALAIHPATGEVYVGGFTASNNFPGRAGGAQATYGGGVGMFDSGDGFISRLNSTLTSVVQSTYLGGATVDEVAALAVHALTGDLYAVGTTSSANFPGTGGGAQPTQGGGASNDAFVSRLNRNLTSLFQSTWLGGGSVDSGKAIAIHPVTGEVYVAGDTQSSAASFPVSPPLGAQPENGGSTDGFVCRLNPALTAINRWTFLGSPGSEAVGGLAIHPATGEVFVAGAVDSNTYPGVLGGLQETIGGFTDTFVSRLPANLMTLIQSTYLGAGSNDDASAIAIHAGTGEIYVAGQTGSGGATFPGVTGGAQANSGGGFDVFVSRMSPDLTAVNLIPNHFSFLAQSNVPPNTLRTSNQVRLAGIPQGGFNLVYVTGQPGSQMCLTDRPGCCVEPTPTPACDGAYLSGWQPSFAQIFGGDYVQVRHITAATPVGAAETNLIIGGAATTFRTSTGNAAFACNLDMDGDNKLDALVEGLVLIRAMFGLTGTAVTNATGITIPWATLSQILNAGCGTRF